MSTVYLAAEEKTDRLWAVKAMRKQSTGDFEMAKQSLLAEASILKKLKHPGLPEITEVIEEKIRFDHYGLCGRIFSGKDRKRAGPSERRKCSNWAKQLCDILSYLHTRNPPVIYRDMKPSNIIRREDGRIVLIDFGTAREFKGGQKEIRSVWEPEDMLLRNNTETVERPMGEQIFMDWEQLCIISSQDMIPAPLLMRSAYTPLGPWLSPGLERIVQKCTRKNPEDRYPSCKALRYDLEHYKQLNRKYKRRQNLRWRGFLAAFFMMLCAGTGALGFWKAGEKVRERSYDLFLLEEKVREGRILKKALRIIRRLLG